MKTTKYFTRLAGIVFDNVRNIEHGEVKFPNAKVVDYADQKSSVLGIYGQNGSGKTTVILAIDLLKKILEGESIHAEGFVKKGCGSARLSFFFSVYDELGNKYNVKYSFELLENGLKTYPSDFDKTDPQRYRLRMRMQHIRPNAQIINETIEYDGEAFDGNSIRHKVLFSTVAEYCSGGEKPFGTRANTTRDAEYKRLVNNDIKTIALLLVMRNEAKEHHQSFFFQKNTYETICANCVEHDLAVYSALRSFGETLVISGLQSQKEVTDMSIILRDVQGEPFMLPLSDPMPLTENEGLVLGKRVKKINCVLSKLIPGVDIVLNYKGKTGVINYEEQPEELGEYELISKRDGQEIPLSWESKGIIKIITILSYFIAAYNDPSVTFAVDEFDAGIFEDLLGVLVQLFSEKGKGQLVFTSHNLRPLEALNDASSILFTTTNSQNKFIKIPVRGNSNLRDVFLRAIKLGGTAETLYNAPDKYEIELSLALSGVDAYEE